MFLLDTDHLGIIQRQSGPEFPTLVNRLRQHPLSDIYVSVISFHEQLAGWQAYLKRAKTSAAVVRAYAMFQQILIDFSELNVAPFDADAGAKFEELRTTGVRRIGTMDLRIAAIAMARNYTVVTRNTVDFLRVPGLAVQDWTT